MFANARKVLSERLLKAVQKRHVGMLWVPSPERVRLKTKTLPDRNARMREARRRGETIRAIAAKFLLSAARVHEVVRGVRKIKNPPRRPA